MKKLSVVEKAPTFFVVMGICIRKTLNTKIKLTCRVFFRKKTVPVQHLLNSGSFFQYSKAQSPKNFCRDRKNKNWSKVKKTSLKGQLSRRGIFITKLSTPKMLTELLPNNRQSWAKEEQAISYPFPKSWGIYMFYRTFASCQRRFGALISGRFWFIIFE